MLPVSRRDEHLYSVPKFDLGKGDIKGFMNELVGFHEQFSDCFYRSESREHFFNYMSGQFSDLERKSIEPIALAVKDGNVRALQRFVSVASWDDDKIISKYRSLVNEDLGSPDGALVFDESGFIKKGQDSVGVARQYCGTAGKVDNCQVGVFAAYVSDHGYAMVDKRLFIPEQWFSEEYYERRQKCNMPEDSVFQTKPQLAAEMLMDIHSENVLPFKYVLADSIYGVSPEFIGAVENLPGITYFVSVPKKTLCWLKRPMTISKRYRWGSYATKDPCLAQRLAMGDRTVFRGSQNRVGHGPLRSAQVYGLASSHPHVHNGTFLSLAPEDQVGGKKHHLLRYRSLEFCSNYCY